MSSRPSPPRLRYNNPKRKPHRTTHLRRWMPGQVDRKLDVRIDAGQRWCDAAVVADIHHPQGRVRAFMVKGASLTRGVNNARDGVVKRIVKRGLVNGAPLAGPFHCPLPTGWRSRGPTSQAATRWAPRPPNSESPHRSLRKSKNRMSNSPAVARGVEWRTIDVHRPQVGLGRGISHKRDDALDEGATARHIEENCGERGSLSFDLVGDEAQQASPWVLPARRNDARTQFVPPAAAPLRVRDG